MRAMNGILLYFDLLKRFREYWCFYCRFQWRLWEQTKTNRFNGIQPFLNWYIWNSVSDFNHLIIPVDADNMEKMSYVIRPAVKEDCVNIRGLIQVWKSYRFNCNIIKRLKRIYSRSFCFIGTCRLRKNARWSKDWS